MVESGWVKSSRNQAGRAGWVSLSRSPAAPQLSHYKFPEGPAVDKAGNVLPMNLGTGYNFCGHRRNQSSLHLRPSKRVCDMEVRDLRKYRPIERILA